MAFGEHFMTNFDYCHSCLFHVEFHSCFCFSCISLVCHSFSGRTGLICWGHLSNVHCSIHWWCSSADCESSLIIIVYLCLSCSEMALICAVQFLTGVIKQYCLNYPSTLWYLEATTYGQHKFVTNLNPLFVKKIKFKASSFLFWNTLLKQMLANSQL